MTTDVRPVTREHIEQLNIRNKEHGQSTKQAVLNAIRLAGDTPIPPHFIKELLDLKALSDKGLRNQYEQGNISLQEWEDKVKDKTVDIRTIQRKLAELTREKLVDNKGGKYALSIDTKSDMRYFARQFGQKALLSFMDNFFSDENNIEQNISNLIKIFGTYVIYCFIEASRPISDNIASSGMDMYSTPALISRYLENVFPVDTMYDYFLGIMKYTFDKNKNKEEEYISLSQELNKLVEEEGKRVPTSGNGGGNNNELFRISAVKILRAQMTMRMKRIKQHTTRKQSGYYDDERQHQRQRLKIQYDLPLKETIRPHYELDQATVKSLDNELRKIIDANTYHLLNIEREIDALNDELKINKMDLSELEKLKSDIDRSKPKNKAVLSMIKNAQDYFGKNKNKA